MAEAKLAPNLPDWMLEHANRYLSSGGTDGHMYKVTVPQRGELTVPSLLLTTTGRKSGDKCWEQKKRAIKPNELKEAEEAYEHARKEYRKILQESVGE